MLLVDTKEIQLAINLWFVLFTFILSLAADRAGPVIRFLSFFPKQLSLTSMNDVLKKLEISTSVALDLTLKRLLRRQKCNKFNAEFMP